jgi:hypothetical protein
VAVARRVRLLDAAGFAGVASPFPLFLSLFAPLAFHLTHSRFGFALLAFLLFALLARKFAFLERTLLFLRARIALTLPFLLSPFLRRA